MRSVPQRLNSLTLEPQLDADTIMQMWRDTADIELRHQLAALYEDVTGTPFATTLEGAVSIAGGRFHRFSHCI